MALAANYKDLAETANEQVRGPEQDVIHLFPFSEAAALLGHDLSTVAGAEDARHDHHVWDLVEGRR